MQSILSTVNMFGHSGVNSVVLTAGTPVAKSAMRIMATTTTRQKRTMRVISRPLNFLLPILKPLCFLHLLILVVKLSLKTNVLFSAVISSLHCLLTNLPMVGTYIIAGRLQKLSELKLATVVIVVKE